jgi:hypothetical protein
MMFDAIAAIFGATLNYYDEDLSARFTLKEGWYRVAS